jgi:hypothetical protein
MFDLARTTSTAHADRDQFRSAVAALPPGPLRDVLTTVAYARDAAARTGASSAPDDRWLAVVAAAERAVRTPAEGFTPRLVAA